MPITILGTDGNPFNGRPGDVDATPNGVIYVMGQLKFTGNYTTAIGGDLLDFTTLNDWVPGSAIRQVAVWSQAGNLLFQYTPNGNLATALNAWRVKLSASATFGTELATGAYPAAVLADIVAFTAVYNKLL
jgi:hypothetical protein